MTTDDVSHVRSAFRQIRFKTVHSNCFQHASVLMGISNTVATLPGILSPPLVGIIVTEKVHDDDDDDRMMMTFDVDDDADDDDDENDDDDHDTKI